MLQNPSGQAAPCHVDTRDVEKLQRREVGRIIAIGAVRNPEAIYEPFTYLALKIARAV